MKIVLVTAPRDQAEALARKIVEGSLAACVSIVPGVRSVYRWKGAIECADESQLVVKCRDSKVRELMTRVAEWHSYDVPEIVVIDVERAAESYAKWVDDETSAS